jgi:hypothetical protein
VAFLSICFGRRTRVQPDGSLAGQPQSPAVLWLIVLVGAIIAALAATIIDNAVKGIDRARSHNNLFLVNECLAEHQSAYLIFAVGLLTGSVVFRSYWTRGAIAIYIFLTFTCYIIGVSITAKQENKLKDFHTCSGPVAKCNVKLPMAQRFRIIWVNLFLGLVLLCFAVYLCLETVKAPG